jgi:hypothetical protein
MSVIGGTSPIPMQFLRDDQEGFTERYRHIVVTLIVMDEKA